MAHQVDNGLRGQGEDLGRGAVGQQAMDDARGEGRRGELDLRAPQPLARDSLPFLASESGDDGVFRRKNRRRRVASGPLENGRGEHHARATCRRNRKCGK